MQTAVRNTAHSLGRPDSKTEATVSKDVKNQNPRTLLWGWEVVRPLWKTAWQFLKPSLPRDLLTRPSLVYAQRPSIKHGDDSRQPHSW